jgi:hypothetical protein
MNDETYMRPAVLVAAERQWQRYLNRGITRPQLVQNIRTAFLSHQCTENLADRWLRQRLASIGDTDEL